MDFQAWMEEINALASLYAFDVMEDGSFSEIRLMAVNRMNTGMLHMNPNAPEFYPGIPYRNYWMDLNFESFVYQCASEGKPLYSYVNARGVWLKGFYLPITDQWDWTPGDRTGVARTVYCLYIVSYSHEVETDSMSQKSPEVANAVMELSIKLHESEDFYQAMAATTAEIIKICGAENCSIYTVDKNNQSCSLINMYGLQEEYLRTFAREMNRTPFEVAEYWERDLALSDCLLLDDLSVIEERDPVWFHSMRSHGIKNLILYAIRNNQTLVGFIWAANYDVEKRMMIKETLELCTFLTAAVISNHQMVSRLEVKSTVDALTQVNNRNAMNERMDGFASGEEKLPAVMGVVFADLNGLKTVNDQEGHIAGDKLLTRAAALLKIAFGDYEIYRAGGDEFVVFCPEITKEKLEQLVSQLRGLCDNTADVSFSVGTVLCSGDYNLYQALQTADQRMYADKEEYYRRHPEKDRRKRNRG